MVAAVAAAAVPTQTPYSFIHPRTDGYVAASSAGFQAPPQSGPPPHQGPPTVLRGMQSTAPPTPPQPDISKMQPPQTQLFVPGTVNNSTSNARANQQNSIYRGSAASTAPRGGGRHVPAAMFSQQIQQVVLPTYQPFAPRQPTFQQTGWQPIAAGYPSYPYQFYTTNSMIPTTAQTHQRGPSGVASAIPVQTGPNGALGGPNGAQPQLSLSAGTVLTATVPGSAAVIGVAPSQSTVQPLGTGYPRKRPRPNALRIINPLTNEDVLDEFNKSGPNSEIEYHEDLVNAPPIADLSMATAAGSLATVDMGDTSKGVSYNMDMMQRTMPTCALDLGQTPIVSAMSDCPSVEIRPTQQPRRKNKSIPIVVPPDHKDNKPQTVNKTAEDTLNKAIKREVYSTSIEAPTVISSITEPSSRNHQPIEGLVSVATNPIQTEDIISSNSNSPNSTLSALSSASSPISMSTFIQQQPTSTAVSKNVTAEKDNTTAGIVNDLANAPAVGKSCTKNDIVTSQNHQSALENMKLSEDEMNFPPHTNRPDDLVTHTSATITSANHPVVIPITLETNNGNGQDIMTGNENFNNNIRKTNVFETNSDLNNTIGNEARINKNNTNTDSSENIEDATPSPSVSVDEMNTSGVVLPQVIMLNTNSSSSSSSSDTDGNALPKTGSNNPVAATPKHSMDLVNNNNNNVIKTKSKSQLQTIGKTTTSPICTPENIDNSTSVTPTSATETDESSTTPSPIVTFELNEISVVQTAAVSNGEGNVSPPPVSDDVQEDPEIMAPGKNKPTPEQEAAMQAAIQSLINYNEGQWSPQNPTGKKQYDRDQLLQLRDAKASRISPDVSTINPVILPQPNPVSQTNLMPSFASRIHPHFKRTNAVSISSMGDRSGMGGMGGMGLSGAGYVKQSSMLGMNQRSAKGNPKSTVFRINLSLNQDVKLNKTDNAWRPRIFVGSGESAHDSEDLKRRVRGILNKLTPEKFDTLVEQIIQLKIDTNEKVNDVMELVFEKAIDEPNFSVSYARLCQRLVDEVKARDERSIESDTRANLKQFRTSLLDKTENEFNENVTKLAAKEKKLQPILEKINECKDPVEKLELQAQLEEEERKIRRRSGGTVRFIGELFKISMLTGKIINSCIDNLVDPKSEDKLECLCKLLTTVGEKFEKTPISKESTRFYSLDNTVKCMQAIASKTDKDGGKITSRVRFMLQDVIDLRKNKWVSNRGETPKTMEEIQKQAKTEQMSTQYMNYGNIMPNSSSGNMSGSGGQSSSGNGSMKKDDRKYGGGGGSTNVYGNNRDGNRGGSGRGGDDGGSMRRQQNQGGNNNMGGNGSSLNNGEDTWYHVPTGKGNRSTCAVDTNKLEPMLNHDVELGTKKMGGMQLFLWNTSGSQSRTTTTPSNSFAVLSTLNDLKSGNERNDRGPRNKSGYNKGSMERDRYDRGVHSRGGSAHGSRESSSTRNNQGSRGMMNVPSIQKQTGHNKNQYQSITPRMQSKSAMHTPSMSASSSRQSSPPHIISSESVTQNIAPVAVFDEPTNTEKNVIKSAISEMVEIASNTKTLSQLVPCLTRFKENLRSYFLFMILTEYLHLANVGQVQRRHAANIIAYYLSHKYISLEHFKLAYEHFCELASELIIDVPELWTYVFQFAALLIARKFITIRDLWNNDLVEEDPALGPKLLKTFLVCCTREIGPEFTYSMWKTLDLKWTDFIPEANVADFIKANDFEYVQNDKIKYKVTASEDKEKLTQRVVERIDYVLREGANGDSIIDYITGNVADISLKFVGLLTKTMCNFAIAYKENTFTLDVPKFRKVCIPVLKFVIDSQEQREHECLNAIHFLTTHLENPKNLLKTLIGELEKAELVTQSSFLKWRETQEGTLSGKNVDDKGFTPFFKKLPGDGTSEEN